jgi:hypothetical protein
MDKDICYIYILIGIIVSLLIVLTIKLCNMYVEPFAYANYKRNNFAGRLLPKKPNNYPISTSKKIKMDDYVKLHHIPTDNLHNKHYKWDSEHHFPYGGFIYDRSYPIYLASNICPEDAPYYNTIDGTCIQVDPSIAQINSPTNTPIIT